MIFPEGDWMASFAGFGAPEGLDPLLLDEVWLAGLE